MYEHTDKDGDTLTVEKGTRGPLIRTRETFHGNKHTSANYYDKESAPGIALAVLENAGEPESHKVLEAIVLLKEHEQERARQKAEDTEVDQYRRLLPALDPYEGVPWEAMTEQGKQMHRDRHHAHKEFFTKAHNHAFGDTPDGTCPACNTGKREPHIIQYGEAAPPRTTEWKDPDGATWSWARDLGAATNEGWYAGVGFWAWSDIKPHHFPMERITK